MTGKQPDSGRQTGRRKRSPKGSVKVESDKGWLRLRFSHQGKRHAFAIGLPASAINQKVAEQRAHQIELDILSGNFDESLKKYKPQIARAGQRDDLITAGELLQQFIEEKAKSVSTKRSLEKYEGVLRHLESFNCKDGRHSMSLAEKPAVNIGQTLAEQLHEHLAKTLTPLTLKQSMTWLSACWRWGQKKRILEVDPWKAMAERVKVPPKQMPKPFTREEIKAIVEGFRGDRYYSHYTDFVEFLFGTGCRTGEAVGLLWKHVSDDCSSVWIGESMSRGVRKATKTNRARTVTLTPKLQAMLEKRKGEKVEAEQIVFSSPKGNPIDDHNFRNRAWKSILKNAGVEYRKPYNTRHTLISHALDQGMNPVAVAQLTGHDVQTLYENYAGNVNSRPQLPEL